MVYSANHIRPSSRPRIAVLEGADQDVPPVDLSTIEGEALISVVPPHDQTDWVATADIVLVWDTTYPDVPGVLLNAAESAWIHVAAAGLDRVLSPLLRGLTTTLTSAAGVQDDAIAEFVVAAALSYLKQFDLAARQQQERTWKDISVRRAAGSNCMIIGCGGIGRATARRLRGLGMYVRGAGRTARTHDPDFDLIVNSATMTEQLRWADIVVVAAPLTAQTAGIIDAAALASMKSDSHLINVGPRWVRRGGRPDRRDPTAGDRRCDPRRDG